MEHKARFAIIGAGKIAQAYAEQFEKSPVAEVVAVVDTRIEAANAMAERLRCKAYSTYQEMASKTKLDAVLVSTPPVTHPEISMFFLNQGVNVLCEKPLSIDSANARKMLQTAEKNNRLLMMASKFRYVDDVVRAKSIIASGTLGNIVLFENSFTAKVDMTTRWNCNPALSGGGVLIDNGTHSVDIMRYLVGPIGEVQAAQAMPLQGLKVEETVRLFARSKSGVMGSIDLSWSIDKQQGTFINVYGSQGSLTVGWKESKYRQSSSPDWITFGKGYDKGQAFQRQIENFVGAFRQTEMPLIAPEDALASVEVIEASYAALQNNRWTPVLPTGRREEGQTLSANC